MEFISFDETQKITTFGVCKICINAITKKLIVIPKNEKIMEISAGFQQRIIPQKNVVFIFLENQDIIDFVLIFVNEEKAKTFMDGIKKAKYTFIDISPNLLSTKFNLPFVKQVIEMKTQLKNSLDSFYDFLPPEELQSLNPELLPTVIKKHYQVKEQYFPLFRCMTNQNKSSVILSSKLGVSVNNHRKRKAEFVKKEGKKNQRLKLDQQTIEFEEDDDDFNDFCINESENESDMSDSDSDFFDNEKVLSKVEGNKLAKNIDKKVVKRPDFEFQKNPKGIPKTRLIIFDSKNPKLCYRYCLITKLNVFICRPCRRLNKNIIAKINKDKNEEECVLLQNFDHVCKMKVYKEEKHEEIIKSPDFELRPNNRDVQNSVLFIFIRNNRDLCYRYYLHEKRFRCYDCYATAKKLTKARLCQSDENGDAYVTINSNDHVCEPRIFQSMKERRIVKVPNYEWQAYSKGVPNSKLIIFVPHDRNLCYEYSKTQQLWYCRGCTKQRKWIGAKVLKNEMNEEYIQILNENHVCNPVPYKSPDNYLIIKAPDFELRPNQFGVADKCLIIFCKEDKNLCYKFSYQPNYFSCLGCLGLNFYLYAKILKNANGETYIQMKDQKHMCQPKIYEANRQTTEIKIINSCDFVISTNLNGIPNASLIIFTSNDRKLCYRFCLNGKSYMCLGCSKQNKRISAHIITSENGQQHIEMKRDHVCKPKEFKLPQEYKTIPASEFKLGKNTSGIPNSILFLFTSSNRKSYYKFYLKSGYFFCFNCSKLKKSTTAKLIKHEDGEEYYLRIKAGDKHICKPTKRKPN